MTVRPPPLGDATLEYVMVNCILDRARDALFALAAGFSTEWVEYIMSGQIYTAVIKIRTPAGKTEEEFSRKYSEFIDKVERKFEFSKKLSCQIVYQTGAVVVLSNREGSPAVISTLVCHCLMGDVPLEDFRKFILDEEPDEDHFQKLSLDEEKNR